MGAGCEFVKCSLFIDGVCKSDTATCVYRTDEERVAELEDMVEQLQAELDKHRWIPVSEGLPKEKGNYLCCVNNSDRLFAKVEYFNGTVWLTVNNITHYRYIILPESEVKK